MKYTHVDREGIRWRFVGSRPVSEIADEVMNAKTNQKKSKTMTDERFNELLAGPLTHPIGMLMINRLVMALRSVVEDCGALGAAALEKHCKEREQQDLLKSGD